MSKNRWDLVRIFESVNGVKMSEAKKGVKECILTEKETLAKLKALLGNDAVWLTQKNAYGDRRKYAFGFGINQIADRYNAKDNSPAGYSHQYDVDISQLLEDELVKNGFKVVNVHVGSWVHGWIHRVVTHSC